VNISKRQAEQEKFRQDLKIVKKVNPRLYGLLNLKEQSGQLEKIETIRKILFMLNMEFAILEKNYSLVRILKKDCQESGKNFKRIFSVCKRKLLTRKNPERELRAQIQLSEIAIGKFNSKN
jgi:hypothetical protein